MTDEQSSVPLETSAPARRQEIVFPQIARLELDELLTQLIERAQDVLDAQGRLRALLSATRAVSEDLDLPLVLERIVQSACQLIGARYGAIGVLAADGTLDQFIHVGMDDEVAQQIGHLPTGRGILGLLIEQPEPLRLEDLHTHPSSVGLPAAHPPMGTFLGVPVRVRDQVFGNIYLTEKSSGRQFTADDEELLVALAGTAAVAIDHAQLYAEAQARQDMLAAAAELTSLADTSANAYGFVAKQVRRLSNADLCVVVAPDQSGKMRIQAADGTGGGAVRGLVTANLVPESVIADLRKYGVDVGASMSLTLGDGAEEQSLVLLSRIASGSAFAPTEVVSARAFLDQAARALSQIHARRTAQLVELLSQRDAIARDMNDQVVSRLFAVGLALEALAGRIAEGDLRTALLSQVDDLDATIKTIRTRIFTAEGDSGGV